MGALMSIVVANESRPSLDRVAAVLEQGGFSVVPCTDPGQAHTVVRATMPNLVLLDSRDAEVPDWHAAAMLKPRKTGLRPHEQRRRDAAFTSADGGSEPGGRG